MNDRECAGHVPRLTHSIVIKSNFLTKALIKNRGDNKQIQEWIWIPRLAAYVARTVYKLALNQARCLYLGKSVEEWRRDIMMMVKGEEGNEWKKLDTMANKRMLSVTLKWYRWWWFVTGKCPISASDWDPDRPHLTTKPSMFPLTLSSLNCVKSSASFN